MVAETDSSRLYIYPSVLIFFFFTCNNVMMVFGIP